MYKRGIYTVAENKKIAKDVYYMTLPGAVIKLVSPVSVI